MFNSNISKYLHFRTKDLSFMDDLGCYSFYYSLVSDICSFPDITTNKTSMIKGSNT